MRQITLRFPEIGYERLMCLCRRHGISIRGLFEAAAAIALDDEADPERHDLQVRMWHAVKVLEASEAFRDGPRHKQVITMEDELFGRLDDACRRFGVSKNAALGLVVMPWPAECADAMADHRRLNFQRMVEDARRLDFSRRGGALHR